ncbi:tetratricopeptide repeat protein [Magnetospirillum sulfuroxidans]|uniref:Tetratricopeptide repeat protein n=1 Tax=Magnetospirillum sulfuroxidans TaxID=611300 RepID=A0ABS5IHR0_9PROT|nr:tetratricopeptide repeat protein [Magnetospirillum sulfuroxidans]MBR9973248.1 tetratricopeptide repeat protein [Magnetospirillum sulfuroxidans]
MKSLHHCAALAAALLLITPAASHAADTAAAQTKVSAQAKSQADKLVAQAKKALAAGNAEQAFADYAKAHELVPGDLNHAHNAASLALALGRNDQALALFKDAITLAVKAKISQDAALYAAEITKLVDIPPAWVAEKIEAASAIPADKSRVAAMWQRARQAASTAAASGDLAQAESRARQALAIAKDNLGETHMAALASAGDLGRLLGMAGKTDEAETVLRQAADNAGKVLGAGHPETLALRNALADHFSALAQYDKAAELALAAAEDAAKDLGADHPRTLDAKLAAATPLLNAGRLNDADKIAQDTCPRYQAQFGADHPATAKCLSLQASTARALGNLDQAATAITQAVAVLRVTNPPGEAANLDARLEAARIAVKRGDAAQARALLEGVIAEAGTAKDLSRVIAAKTDLADVLVTIGEYAAAEATIRQVVEANTQAYGPNHPATVSALSSLGSVQRQQGNLREAEATFQDAHDRFLKVLGPDHQFTIIAANNLGEILEKSGLFDRAEPLLRDALEGSRKAFGDDHPNTVIGMNNLALLHESQGEFDKAEALYKSALAIHTRRLGAKHPNTIAFANNLAYLHMLQGNYEQAASEFTQVVAEWTRLNGPTHIDTLKAQNNLGRALMGQGKLAEAEPILTKTLAARRQSLGERHLDTLRSMHDMGVLLRKSGRADDARTLLEQTLAADDAVLGKVHPYTFETLNSLAATQEDKGDFAAALKTRRETFLRRNDFLNTMLYVTGENAREGYVRLHSPELAAYEDLLVRTGGPEAGRALIEISLFRKGLLLKVASEISQANRLSGNPELAKLTGELEATRKKLGALTLSGPVPETADRHAEILVSLRDRIDILQGQLGRASARFLQTTDKISVDQLVAALPENSALVDFLLYGVDGQQKLVAATMTKKDGKAQFGMVAYADAQKVGEAVLKYRKDIQDEEIDFDELLESGQKTYDLIWKPIAKTVGEAPLAYVIPDGVLNIMPFAALVEGDGKYLMEGLDLHIFTSTRNLLPSRLKAAKGGYMINAGPDYETDAVTGKEKLDSVRGRSRAAGLSDGLRGMSSGMRGLRFDPLPGAEREGQIIRTTVDAQGKKSVIYSKGNAQESVLRQMTEAPEVLHIATHGFFLKADDTLRKRLLKLQRGGDIQIPPPGDNPLLRAGLAFAGINANAPVLGEIDTDNDGVLTALEVLDLNLAGTQLAILSACETGLGEIHEGEGVYGLRRAFQEAGVASVVSSLWEVSDAGTQALMGALYSRLMKGMPPHLALREAQLEMLRIGQWSSPYIWSAFFMVDG